jgi:hypothetical protein
MISNEYHLLLMKAELAKRRDMLMELEGARLERPRSLSSRVGILRMATIRQEIRELAAEIRDYEATKRSVGMSPARTPGYRAHLKTHQRIPED